MISVMSSLSTGVHQNGRPRIDGSTTEAQVRLREYGMYCNDDLAGFFRRVLWSTYFADLGQKGQDNLRRNSLVANFVGNWTV